MIERDLTQEEITAVLQEQCYAHIGFFDTGNKMNILPVTYVYDDGKLYSFSEMGSKIEAMRKHPEVCVQVELLQSPESWKSVQMWGTYSEVQEDSWSVIEKLINNFWDHADKNDVIYTPMRDFELAIHKGVLVYQVEIDKYIGKLGVHESRSV